MAVPARSSAGRGSGPATEAAGWNDALVDLLYLAQWLGCLAALTGGTAVLWYADSLPVHRAPVRWTGTVLAVGLLIATLGLWLVMAGEATRPALVDRAHEVGGAVQLVALAFLVLLHPMAHPEGAARWYARGASLLCLGFGFVLGAGAQVAFPAVAWSRSDWLQWTFFAVTGIAMHCALVSRGTDASRDAPPAHALT